MKKLLFLLLLPLFSLCSEEIVILLERQAPQKKALFSFGYSEDKNLGERVFQTLLSDLDFSGEIEVIQKTFEKQQNETFTEQFSNNESFDVQLRVFLKNRLLFASVYDAKNEQVYAFDPVLVEEGEKEERSSVHRVTDAIYKSVTGKEGIFSTHILYTIKDPMGTRSDLYESDFDGFSERVVIQGEYCVTPCYLPSQKGKRAQGICYVSYIAGQPKIYFSDLSGQRKKRASMLSSNQLMPAVSKDQKYLAFISDATANPDLFVQPLSGARGAEEKPFQLFSARGFTQGTPTFSPDGKSIAFVSNKDGSPRIYLMDTIKPSQSLKSLKPKLLTRQNYENSAPCFSPDGKKIAYCAKTNGFRQIWIYDFETGKEIQVTSGSTNKENPSFAKNSEHLVFNSVGERTQNLFVLHIPSKKVRPIKEKPALYCFPAWEL